MTDSKMPSMIADCWALLEHNDMRATPILSRYKCCHILFMTPTSLQQLWWITMKGLTSTSRNHSKFARGAQITSTIHCWVLLEHTMMWEEQDLGPLEFCYITIMTITSLHQLCLWITKKGIASTSRHHSKFARRASASDLARAKNAIHCRVLLEHNDTESNKT